MNIRKGKSSGQIEKSKQQERQPGFGLSFFVFLLMVGVLLYSVIILKLTPHIPVFCCSLLLILYSIYLRIPWKEMQDSITDSIKGAIESILLVLLVGGVIGEWIAAGTVPFIIYYGLQLLSARWFLLFVLLICTVMSTCTGSSWTTTATLGIAFIGIGTAMGIPNAITAGAILSGAYFGDKQSPIAASANFAAAASKTGIYELAGSMLYSSIPSLLVCAVIFAFLGSRYQTEGADLSVVNDITEGIAQTFSMTPVLLLPLILLIFMIIKKVPALLAMMAAMGSGFVLAVAVQGASLKDALSYIYSGYVCQTGNDLIDTLLTRGGFTYMASTVILMILSMTMAGCLQRTRVMPVIMDKIRGLIRGDRSLIMTTLVMAMILSCATGDIYPSALITSNAMMDEFDLRRIHRSVLGRTLQDGTTIITTMQPWSTCGIYSAMTLGVSVTAFLPYYFMGFVTPVFSALLALTGIGVRKCSGSAADASV